MSDSPCDPRLRAVALWVIGTTLAATLLFFVVQNRLALTGGGVAFAKSAWLGLALTFWLVLPALILRDRRLAPGIRRPFVWLLVLMALRSVAELWMLYVAHNWLPVYGIAHDLTCLTVLWVCVVRALRTSATTARPALHRWLTLHTFVTGALFLPEVYFATYMQAHFTTHGTNPVYFVPAGEAHRLVLAITAAVDVLAVGYLALFLYAWLNGTSARARS